MLSGKDFGVSRSSHYSFVSYVVLRRRSLRMPFFVKASILDALAPCLLTDKLNVQYLERLDPEDLGLAKLCMIVIWVKVLSKVFSLCMRRLSSSVSQEIRC